MELEIPGYPLIIFYAVAFIGVVLILYRPRWAFYFIVFGLAVRHFHMAVFTRTPFLGEFVNLNDLFLWIGVFAMLRISWQSQTFWIPNILLVIIGILILGDFQTLSQYGFNYQVLQGLWASWIFPILFVVSANVVRNTQDARSFYWALFWGAVGAALQHLFIVQTQIMDERNLLGILGVRTISYIMSGGIFLVISAFFVDMRKILNKYYIFILWAVGISLIAISYLLSFTRTVWVGALMAFITLFIVFFREQRKMLSRLGYSMVLLALILAAFQLTSQFLLTGADIQSSIDERVDFIRYEDAFDEAYQTRETGMETELKLWQSGTFIWGVGASYPPSLLQSSMDETGALGHVAFSAYLAHFGLIGFLAYGVFLPLLTIRIGRRYYFQHRDDIGGVIAVTAMALALFDLFTLLSSNHYLSSTTHVQGLIFGSLWGLSRSLKVPAAARSAITQKNPNARPRALSEPAKI
jgi:hypothetical protein